MSFRLSILHFFLFIIIIFLAGCYKDFSPQGSVFDISATEAHNMIQDNANNPDFVIIDVRS